MIKWLRLKYKAWRWPETMDCENCAGSGIFPMALMVCPTCKGTGVQR